jgi:hypothetical protein
VTYVARQRIEPRHQLHVATRLAHAQRAPELRPRRHLGLGASHAARNEIVDARFEVKRELVVQGSLDAARSEHVRESGKQ